MIAILVFSLVTLIFSLVAYIRHSYDYWKRRNVPYLQPKFPLGNSTCFPKGISVGAITKKFYEEFRRTKTDVGGVYIGIDPKLMVMNPDMIKDIMATDFQYFTDRGVYQCESDPISVNIFSQPGAEWKKARIKFTPLFSSTKLKGMFQTMLSCSEGLKEALEKLAEEKSDVDIMEMAACFTTDVIGSSAFGVDCNSFKHPDAEFRTMGRKLFSEFNLMDRLNLFLSVYFPNLARQLGVRNIQKDISRFFFRTVRETVEYREKNNVKRNDLLQVLIDMKNSEDKLSMDSLTAQVFLFFAAGFETSSTTTCMALYEISRNEKVQNRLREEIKSVLGKYDGKITYEGIAQMKYLGQVVDETLRLWPPVSTITRVCTKNYELKGTGITVEEGTYVMIPVLGLHHDPEYWPDPMQFDPDRFSEENKVHIHSGTYLPFGDGPRNCIGFRMGPLQSKLALIILLSRYKVSLSPKTVTPLGINVETFILRTLNKVYLQLEKD